MIGLLKESINLMAERKKEAKIDVKDRFRKLYLAPMDNEKENAEEYWYKRLIIRKYLREIFEVII